MGGLDIIDGSAISLHINLLVKAGVIYSAYHFGRKHNVRCIPNMLFMSHVCQHALLHPVGLAKQNRMRSAVRTAELRRRSLGRF